MLKVTNLSVTFNSPSGPVKALDGLSYTLNEGEILAVVGESGCGKTVHSLALTRLLPKGAEASGEVLYKGKDVLKTAEKDLRALRGAEIGMIFQDPMMSLNPVFTVAAQMTETLRAHLKISKKEALK
ncbi:MAG: ATP-binding cassette domain-containing protein, partial [Elusimicrobia bacterium]|nr:ATP-binding cassette domain-containing protein [Elusimicrobiota bacterium]